MLRRFVLLLSTTVVLCYAFAEIDFVATSAHPKDEYTEDKLLTNIIRARNSTKLPFSKSNDSEQSFEKQPRTAIHRLESDSRDKWNIFENSFDSSSRVRHEQLEFASSSCCGPRHDSKGSSRPESYQDKVPGDGHRYSLQYGERFPVDRYGWQTQGQPPGSNGNGGRPAGGSHAGTSLYEGSQAGDRFSSRPNYGSESTRRPSGYESGGYGYGNGGYGSGRPNGYWGAAAGYGISGTLANGDEFGPVEPSYSEGNAPSHPNIQAQKAVALKALAGVALIGAAAALATNPVLLPIGIVSGRKKRSTLPIKLEVDRMNHILGTLKDDFAKVYSNGNGNKISVSPTCIARLACEIQKNYKSDFGKNIEHLENEKDAEQRLTDLISSNVVNKELIDVRVRNLIKMATTVALNGGNCNVFTCTFIKTAEAKNRSIVFKL